MNDNIIHQWILTDFSRRRLLWHCIQRVHLLKGNLKFGKSILVGVGGDPFTCSLLMCRILQVVVQVSALGKTESTRLSQKDKDVPVSSSSLFLPGDPHRNIIMWLDHRAISQVHRINETKHSVLQYVGGVMSVEMQAPKLLWLKEVSAQGEEEMTDDSRGCHLWNLSVPGTQLKSVTLDFFSSNSLRKVDPILLIRLQLSHSAFICLTHVRYGDKYVTQIISLNPNSTPIKQIFFFCLCFVKTKAKRASSPHPV